MGTSPLHSSASRHLPRSTVPVLNMGSGCARLGPHAPRSGPHGHRRRGCLGGPGEPLGPHDSSPMTATGPHFPVGRGGVGPLRPRPRANGVRSLAGPRPRPPPLLLRAPPPSVPGVACGPGRPVSLRGTRGQGGKRREGGARGGRPRLSKVPSVAVDDLTRADAWPGPRRPGPRRGLWGLAQKPRRSRRGRRTRRSPGKASRYKIVKTLLPG